LITKSLLAKIAATVLILLCLRSEGFAQTATPADAELVQHIKQLYADGRWADVLEALPANDNENADLQLYRGLTLARFQRWEESRQSLQFGAARHPRDPRFPVELGGIAYQQSNFSLAKRELRRGLRLDPRDAYANTFLASIYFLEGNLEAALKYWNRAGKPRLTDLKFLPQPKLNPLVLDRALKFSPATEWRRDQYLSTRAQLEALRLYSSPIFDLKPNSDDTFDLTVRAPERNGWGSTPWEGGLSLLRGLPYQTVYPELYNLRGKGLNWRSLVRWDDQKRRFSSEIAAPLGSDPTVRFRIYVDGRNENWNLTNTLLPFSPSSSGMNLQKAVAGAEIQMIPNGRWRWSTGVEYSYRTFQSVAAIPAQAAPFFTNGSSLALRARAERSLIRVPESRFTLDGSAAGEVGTFFENPLGRYGRIEGSLAGHWFPRARGDDYELLAGVKGGETFGKVPFDELFSLGFERDNGLYLRGHPDLVHGQKGNGPLGRNYALANSELDKIVYHNGLFAVRAGPFLDTGRIYDPSGFFGARNWLWDTGLQTKIRVLGSFEFVLGYGKDLRTGRNSFFTKVSR
jgi:tetratricopeptide (TPR) repeat protein